MENKPMISVIVPVYQTKPYLDACVASLVGQTYRNLQIILIDDGSKDGSGEICDAWEKRDNRIQVIHQANAGVSAARNAALEAATGELIAFADSDDVVPAQAYERLIAAMDGRDMAMGAMMLMSADGRVIEKEYAPLPDRESTLDAFLMELFREKSGCYLGFLCDKLLKREIIKANHIRFKPKVKLNEDRLFLLEYLICCNSFATCSDVVYYYRQRSAGVITSTRNMNTVTDSEMTVIDSFEEMSRVAKQYSPKLHAAVARKAFESALDLYRRVDKGERVKVKRILEFMRENAKICVKNPQEDWMEKIKLVGHWVLRR